MHKRFLVILCCLGLASKGAWACEQYTAPDRDPARLLIGEELADSGQFIRDAVAIYIAEDHARRAAFRTPDGGVSERAVRPYSTVDEFLSLNPNCCVAVSYGPEGFRPPKDWQDQNGFRGLVIICRPRLIDAETGDVLNVPLHRTYFVAGDGRLMTFSD